MGNEQQNITSTSSIIELQNAIKLIGYKKKGKSGSSKEYDLGTKCFELEMHGVLFFDRSDNINRDRFSKRISRLNSFNMTNRKFKVINIDEFSSKVIRLE